ncbi:hypothetical protein F2Q68_00018753 [Brassica cretica]|uniref:Uncharacterized protein n=1 Tax=Brassica cretica TaxID=69181 RepID=A0A8S9FPI6_BRACR|nr:hypothetical protein F2Q68_00018753 [Brassica cretica]
MACCVNYISPPRASLSPPPSRSSFSFSGDAVHSLLREPTLLLRRHSRSPSIVAPRFQVVAAEKAEPPLKIMISGAPASGKGTQCELITQKVKERHFLDVFLVFSSSVRIVEFDNLIFGISSVGSLLGGSYGGVLSGI